MPTKVGYIFIMTDSKLYGYSEYVPRHRHGLIALSNKPVICTSTVISLARKKGGTIAVWVRKEGRSVTGTDFQNPQPW